MNNQGNNRGRGNAPRGRGRGRGRGQGQGQQQPPPPVFAPPPDNTDPARLAAARENQAQIQRQLDANRQQAERAQVRPRNPNVDKYIEEGKKLVSSFFKGFNPVERGNVQIDLDTTIGNRLSVEYYDRIENTLINRFTNDDEQGIEDKTQDVTNQFRSAIHIGLAIKLYRSGTDNDQLSTKNLFCIQNRNVLLPPKCGVIINQLGKTDLPNDNKLRIRDQGLMAKRFLARAALTYFGEEVTNQYLTEYMTKPDSDLYTYKNLLFRIENDEYFKNMVDNSSASVDYIRNLAESEFNKLRVKTHKITVYANDKSEQIIKISLPEFNFKTSNVDKVIEYLNNPLYAFIAGTNADPDKLFKIVSLIVGSILNLSVMRKPGVKLEDWNSKFKDSIIATVRVDQILDMLKAWNINMWLRDDDLDDLGTRVLTHWNNTAHINIKDGIKFDSIKFSEFGSDSQVVEVDERNVTTDDGSFRDDERTSFGKVINIIRGKAASSCKIKISETGAVFGSAVKFSREVFLTTGNEIQFSDKNRNILRQFLKDDFVR